MSDTDKPYTMIEEQVAADFLLRGKHSKYLYPFLSEACTLSDVAELFDINLSSLFHHVKKMIRLGLIEEVGTTLRNNRQVRLYRAVSEQFVVPIHAGSSTTLETHMQQYAIDNAMEMGRLFAKSMSLIAEEWGVLISLGDKGLSKVVVPRADSRNGRDVLDDFYPTFWRNTTYFLNDDDAVQLAHELEDLYAKYKKKSLENSNQAKPQKVVFYIAPEDT